VCVCVSYWWDFGKVDILTIVRVGRGAERQRTSVERLGR
jgi:hypothetical protein